MSRKLVLLPLAVAFAVVVWWLGRPVLPASEPTVAVVPSAPSEAPAKVLAESEPAAPATESRESAAAPPAAAAESVSPAEARLVIRVESREEHAPLAGVRVWLSRSDVPSGTRVEREFVDGAIGDVGHAPLTGGDGTATLTLEPATRYSMFVHWEGHRAEAISREIVPLNPGEQRSIEIEITTRYSVVYRGRVVAREDDTAIAGARVRVDDLPVRMKKEDKHEKIVPLADLRTDEQGRFELTAPSWTTLTGAITARGRSLAYFVVRAGHETVEREEVIRLSTSATLRVRVVGRDGSGVPAITVRATANGSALIDDKIHWTDPGDPQFQAETAADGRCMLVDLPSECALSIELLRDRKSLRKESQPVSLAPGEERDAVFELGTGARITGRIVDPEGHPLAKQVVWLAVANKPGPAILRLYPPPVAQKRADESGAFAFLDVADGDYWVGPEPKRPVPGAKPAERLVPLAEFVRVEKGNDPPELLVRVHPGEPILGRVVDEEGHGILRASVLVSGGDPPSYYGCGVQADGSFESDLLLPGEYQLSARSDEHAPSPMITAHAGDRGVTLVLSKGGSISGEVRGADGVLVASSVALSYGRDCTEILLALGSAPDGRFHFGGLPPCTFALIATTPDGRCGILEKVEVARGASVDGLHVELAPGARLRVRCASGQGYGSIALYQGGLYLGGDGLEAGSARTFVVPKGALIAQERRAIGVDGEKVDHALLLAEGEEQELVIEPMR